MKKTIPILVLGLLAMPFFAHADFLDNCTTFNSNIWNKANWAMGRGSVLPADINPSGGGVLNFEIPANTYDGGEIYSKAQYGYGQTEAEFKCPKARGVISSVYMYQGTSTSDEIDIEVYINSGGEWEIAFTVYKQGVKTWSHVYYPTWDPSAGYNDYEIDYESNVVTFYVNGSEEAQCNTASELPTNPMNIQLIDWWPAWLTATQATSNEYMQINWISYTAD
jgi:beta-glucanase (GH16 family)